MPAPDGRKDLEAPGRAFKVVILYEDFSAELRARELSDRVACGLEKELEAWSFEGLGNERVRERSATLAARADMLVIAASGHKQLPDELKEWLETWLPQRQGEPTALVAMFQGRGTGHQERSQPANFLSRIAERGRMDFFGSGGEFGRPVAQPPVSPRVKSRVPPSDGR